MNYALKAVTACLLGLFVAGVAGYGATTHMIQDARAQGVLAAAHDAGVADLVVPSSDGQKVSLPSLTSDPAKAYDTTKGWFMKGPFQGVVFLILIAAAFIHRRLEPADKDGDGVPDPDGSWKGKTWAITGALVMVGVPGFALLTHQLGADWAAVTYSIVGAFGLLMSNLNPKRGALAKA